MIDFSEDRYYPVGDVCTDFNSLPLQVQEDLSDWYNVRDLDDDDKELLFSLVSSGKFRAWSCPNCQDRVYMGAPDNWGHFQGTRNADFSSYPGDTDKYTGEYLAALCDSCRLHS